MATLATLLQRTPTPPKRDFIEAILRK